MTNRFDKARESQKLAILQLYTCIPPGRTHEYCSLHIRECTTDTFALENLQQNILIVSPSRLVLSIGDYKTYAAMGTQHRELTGVQYLGTHLRYFLDNHRPLLMNGKKHREICQETSVELYEAYTSAITTAVGVKTLVVVMESSSGSRQIAVGKIQIH